MTYARWLRLPKGLLKKDYKYFCRFNPHLQTLIFELAEKQKFKCALCTENRDLVIEHDHDPEEGPSRPYTIYNVRGLVCDRCNQALRGREMEDRGEYGNWEHGYPFISDHVYEQYVYAYRCRVYSLNQEAHERRVGCCNPEYRRRVVQKFDAWFHEKIEYPPLWYRRYKEGQSRKIETLEDLIRVGNAITQFLKENPNFVPLDEAVINLGQIRAVVEKLLDSVPQERKEAVLSRARLG